MSLSPGKPEGRGPRGNHMQRDCRRDGRVSSIAPLKSTGSRREDRASGRPRSLCVVRQVSPHRTCLADDDERCRVSVRSARVTVRPSSPNQGPHRHRNELAAGTAGHVPLPTFSWEQSRVNTVRAAPLEQTVSGGRPRASNQGRSRIRRLVLSRARGRTFRRQKRPSASLRLYDRSSDRRIGGETTFAE